MADLILRITLISDTTFGRGDGVAGVVDAEAEHDAATGLPIIKGRTLKGLLVEECANLLYSLQQIDTTLYDRMWNAAVRLFGVPGSDLAGQSILHIGMGTLPADFTAQVTQAVAAKQIKTHEVLEALTTIRHQTAVDAARDIPLDNTLRAVRVILRGTIFTAPITVHQPLNADDKMLLAACAAALQRAGQSRNRGRGRISVAIDGLDQALHQFNTLLTGGRP